MRFPAVTRLAERLEILLVEVFSTFRATFDVVWLCAHRATLTRSVLASVTFTHAERVSIEICFPELSPTAFGVELIEFALLRSVLRAESLGG